MNSDVTWIDAAQVVAAVAGLLVAALVAFMPYARRPKPQPPQRKVPPA